MFLLKESQENEVTSSSDVVFTREVSVPSINEEAISVQSTITSEEPVSTTECTHVSQTLSGTDDKPVDLSTKKENDPDSTDSTVQGGMLSCGLKPYFFMYQA